MTLLTKLATSAIRKSPLIPLFQRGKNLPNEENSPSLKKHALSSAVEGRGQGRFSILLKNPKNASTKLSTNGKFLVISTVPPFVLRLSKDERRVFQQNLKIYSDPKPALHAFPTDENTCPGSPAGPAEVRRFSLSLLSCS